MERTFVQGGVNERQLWQKAASMDSNLQQAFWTWALTRYEDIELRDCLLALQESRGLVVVEALFFAWLAEQGRQLDLSEAQHMEEAITPWVERVLLPLRRERVAWGKSEDAQRLYREALRLELEAEKTLAALLCETLAPQLAVTGPVSCQHNLSLITSLSC